MKRKKRLNRRPNRKLWILGCAAIEHEKQMKVLENTLKQIIEEYSKQHTSIIRLSTRVVNCDSRCNALNRRIDNLVNDQYHSPIGMDWIHERGS